MSQRQKPWLLDDGLFVGIVALVTLAVNLYAGRHYGHFVDELYYLACAQHLAWGYVDQPPLIALVAFVVRNVLGTSLPAIRLLPSLAGAGLVVLSGAIARELGGKRFAQGTAALCILLAPGFLAINHILSMNAFEPLFWMGCAYLMIRIIRTGNPKLWLCFGALAGVGLENRGAPPRPSATAFRGPIRLAGDGGNGGRRLQQLAAGCTHQDGDLRPELWASRGDRSLRP
jgi:4-amino-4-deoxy-L-arabinose transferase-like glycosyltransferase